MRKPGTPAGEKGIRGSVSSALAHDSAGKHVSGKAIYVDDESRPSGLLHCYVATSPSARGTLKKLDIEQVKKQPGVVAVLTAADIPGLNDLSPLHVHDEPIIAGDRVEFLGQVIFAVAAETRDAARRAARLAVLDIEEQDPILDVKSALQQQSLVQESHQMLRGDPDGALAAAEHRLAGTLEIGGQDHFYLEGQAALAIPREDGDLYILSSTQHPSEVQHLTAQALGVEANAITVEVRRMGGAFGGKETQASQWAIIAGLMASQTGRPVKLRLDRDDDMGSTGKRHDFLVAYDVGFDAEGRIEAVEFELAARCGMSLDLSGAIADRAMFHADNAYYLPNVRILSHRCKTNTVSNTAFRGFGGPQGMLAMERVIDAIAAELGKDPLEVRRINLYGDEGRNITPYYMVVEDNVLPAIFDELESSSDYHARRAEIEQFNRESPIIKKGIALTPVKFGISFTTQFLNQAGALIHVYKDGSIHLNHGGTEMGQGLFIKVAQVVANAFQVDIDHIKISATRTDKVPNTSATAASAGADMNGMAALDAALKIKQRLIEFAAGNYAVDPESVVFDNNRVQVGKESKAFSELVMEAYLARVSLSATGFYRTPKIFYDREQARGRPFLYFAYGAAVSEVEVDSLTGENRIARVDILHDVGNSLNPAVDMGQIEGGFVQGAGWLTSEELCWDSAGKLQTHAPSTYKIPVASDVPAQFNVNIWKDGSNREATIHRSKAVGEPPLMLAISVYSALNHAISSFGEGALAPLDAPATPERVLNAIRELSGNK
jgi:xanthine dehydrogenase large subunit